MRSLTFFLITLAGTAMAQAETCPKRDLASAETRTARSLLVHTKIDVEHTWTDVPPDIAGELVSFKKALATTVDAEMECLDSHGEPLEAPTVEADLARLLDANKPYHPSPNVTDGIYGSDLKLTVTKPDGTPHLIIVKARFGINCGEDTVLLIYEQTETKWHRALLWESDPYDSIAKAFGDMYQYAILRGRSATDSPWKLAVAHGKPWCTSRWSGFDLDLLAPVDGDRPQRVIWHMSHGYVREDFNNRMRVTEDGFELRVETGTIETEKMTRPAVFRYRVDGDKVTREQPIAYNGRDFVDEWLQSDWNEAKRWSDTNELELEGLKQNHDHFDERYTNKENTWTYSYGAVNACGDKQLYQVRIDSDPGGPAYYKIRQEQNGYTMMSVAGKPDAGCKGRDLMQGK